MVMVPLGAKRVGAGVSDVEAIVRPFYVAAPATPAPRPLTQQPTEETGQLHIEINVRPDIVTMKAMGFIVNFDDEDENNENEIDREFHIERVTNPEDEEQYVDVEVIDSVTLRNPNKKTKRTLTFNNDSGS